MASLLDISLLNQFSNIFVILFVFTAAYAVLMFRKPFGEVKGINALLAFTISILFIFSQDAIDIVLNTIPWIIIMMIVMMFVLMTATSFGGGLTESVVTNMGTWILIISVIILVINVSHKFGQQAGPYLGNESVNPDSVIVGESGDTGSGSFSQNFGATLFHPKVLGMILVLVVALFAVLWIGYVK